MKQLKHSLRCSLWEGACSAGMTGLVENYLIPFALALKATAAQVGILASVPNLVSALIQSQTLFITHLFRGPKRALLVLSQIQSWVLLLMPGLVFFPEDKRIQGLVTLAIIFTTSGGLLLSIWGTIISKYLPLKKRSGYFGWRNQIMGYLVISGSAIGGIILFSLRSHNPLGFAALFILAGLLKFTSYFFTRHVYEPNIRYSAHITTPLHVTQRVLDHRLRSFLVFIGLMNFSCSLVGPLFSVHMLNGLHFNYFTYMILISTSQFMNFFMMAKWGRHANGVGNIQVIRLTTTLFPLLPVLWIFSSNAYYLFLIQILGGSVWSGYNLCTQNYIYDAMPGSERIQASATFNMINGLGVFLGATIGSQLLDVLPPIKGHCFFSLILISAVGRIMVEKIFLPRVKEVRPIHCVSRWELLLSFLGIKPLPWLTDTSKRIIVKTQPGI